MSVRNIKCTKELLKKKDLLDFSNYPKDLKYLHNVSTLVVNEMNNKTYNLSIKGLVEFDSKIYTSKIKDNLESIKCKRH